MHYIMEEDHLTVRACPTCGQRYGMLQSQLEWCQQHNKRWTATCGHTIRWSISDLEAMTAERDQALARLDPLVTTINQKAAEVADRDCTIDALHRRLAALRGQNTKLRKRLEAHEEH